MTEGDRGICELWIIKTVDMESASMGGAPVHTSLNTAELTSE